MMETDGGNADTVLPFPSVAGEIADVIREHDSFLVAGHVRPDGDCLGSALAMHFILRQAGKRVECFNASPFPALYRFLPEHGAIRREFPAEPPQVTICLDSSDLYRIREDFRPEGLVVNIDHHAGNTNYGILNWVDSSASAVGEQVFLLAQALGAPVSPLAATCLYTAIMTDTGRFRFSNTTGRTFRIVAKLAELGADPAAIAESVYENCKPETVQLVGTVYSNLQYELGGRFVWGEVRRALYDRIGGEEFEPEGLTNDIRQIEGVEIGAMFYETRERYCRVGLRSKGRVDVSALARQFGGGGHAAASGALVKQPYETARDLCLETIRRFLG